MCGIVGVIKERNNPVSLDEFEDFKKMLAKAQYRGRQATGVVYVFENGRIFCCKTPGESSKVIDFLPYRSGIRALLGHTRASTGGNPLNNENNHPHETENWALIHNGICDSTVDEKDLELISRCDTEEFVATFEYMKMEKELSSEPITKIVTESLSKMQGSWSLAFVHKPSGRLFLTTNGVSPLVCFYYSGGMMFASLESYFKELTSFEIASDTKGKSKLTTVKNWESGEHVELFQVFEPGKEILFEVSDQCTLEDCGAYTTVPRKYSSTSIRDFGIYEHGCGYNRSAWNPTPKARAVKVDPDLMTEKDWQAKYGDETGFLTKKEFDEMCYSMAMSPPSYDIDTEITNFNCYSTTELRVFAIKTLEEDFDLFKLDEPIIKAFLTNYRNGNWNKPTKRIQKKINKTFSQSFISGVDDELDFRNQADLPSIVWSLVDDYNTINVSIYDKFEWWERIIVGRFGIEIFGLFEMVEDVNRDTAQEELYEFGTNWPIEEWI